MKLRLAAVLVIAQLVSFSVAEGQSKSKERWVGTWATAQALVRTPPPAGRGGAGPAPAAAAPATAAPQQLTPQAIGARGFSNHTVRMIVRTSIGGKRVRVKLANAFAGTPVQVGAAHIAIVEKESGIVGGSGRALTFGGKPSFMLGPGVVLLSDPVELNIAPVSEVAVSLYFPGETGPPTTHATGLRNTYVAAGDHTADAALTDAITTQSFYWLAGLDVVAPANAGLIVTYGDSITDGARSTPNTHHSWPALLAARLAANKATANIGVANMGIGGNRVLRDGTGASALARLDRDVFSQSGVKWLMLLEGINDIGRGATVPEETVTAEEIIAAYKQIIERAHTLGIKVIGCTLTPYGGAGYARENGEAVRAALNAFIRTGGAFDGVVDFEAATRDSSDPKKLRAEFDPGDHLHPNDAGYEAMAKAVDLRIFAK